MKTTIEINDAHSLGAELHWPPSGDVIYIYLDRDDSAIEVRIADAEMIDALERMHSQLGEAIERAKVRRRLAA